MKVTKRIDGIAHIYIVASIIIGPGLVFLIASFAPGPIGDCGDDAWTRAGISFYQEVHVITHYDLIIRASEGIMFCIGAVIAGLLIARPGKLGPVLLVTLLVVLLGYGFIIWIFSGTPSC